MHKNTPYLYLNLDKLYSLSEIKSKLNNIEEKLSFLEK